MPGTDHYMLHDLYRGLIHGPAPNRSDAMIIARWIADPADIFGRVSSAILASERAAVHSSN